MPIAQLLSEALRAIRAHLLRSFLTLLGIIIGVTTLVGVVSVIAGLNAFVQDKVIQLAPDVYVVEKYGFRPGRAARVAAVPAEHRKYDVRTAQEREGDVREGEDCDLSVGSGEAWSRPERVSPEDSPLRPRASGRGLPPRLQR